MNSGPKVQVPEPEPESDPEPKPEPEPEPEPESKQHSGIISWWVDAISGNTDTTFNILMNLKRGVSRGIMMETHNPNIDTQRRFPFT